MLPAWLSINNSRKISSYSNISSTSSINNSSSSTAININSLNKYTPNHQYSTQYALLLDKENKHNPNVLCDDLINNLFYLSNKLVESSMSNTPKPSKARSSMAHSYSFQNSFDYSSFFSSLKNSFSGGGSNGSGLNQTIKAHAEKKEITSVCFLNRILSTLLKYHLSWVLTVLPAATSTSSTHSSNGSSDLHIVNHLKAKKKTKLRKQSAEWTCLLESTNPYNALWAQLGDLHGAINSDANKLVRTVIIGKDRELVERLITFLSYFIRCGNSVYFDAVQDKFDFDEMLGTFLNVDKNKDDLPTTPSKATSNVNTTTAAAPTIATKTEASKVTKNSHKSLDSQSSTESSCSPVSAATKRAESESTIFLCEFLDNDNSSAVVGGQINDHATKENALFSSNVNNNSTNTNDESCNAQELPLIG